MRHRQVMLSAFDGCSASANRVDAGMAPLLRQMWRCGLHTEFSCEGYDDEAMIVTARWVQKRLALIVTGSERPPKWRFDVNSDGPYFSSLYFPKVQIPDATERARRRADALAGRAELPGWPEQVPSDPIRMTFSPGGAA